MVINGREITCLIVEDYLPIAEVAKVWLLRRGIPTGIATSRDQAVEMLKKKQYSFLLLDHSMSGMTMSDFLPVARELVPEMQIILTTGENAFETGSKYGIGFVIQKPYDEDFLMSYVFRIFRSKQASGLHFTVG